MNASRRKLLTGTLIQVITLFALLALAGMPVFTPLTSAAPAALSPVVSGIDRALIARAGTQATVRIIVGVRSAARPEGSIQGAAAVGQQRAAIAQLQQSVLTRHAKEKVGGVKRFASIPFMAMEVDAATLRSLA